MSATINAKKLKFAVWGHGFENVRNNSGEGEIIKITTLKIVDPNEGYIGSISFDPIESNVNPFILDSITDYSPANYLTLSTKVIQNSHDTIINFPRTILYLVDADWVNNSYTFWTKMRGDVINQYLVVGDNLIKDTKLYLGEVGNSYIKVADLYETSYGRNKNIVLEYYTKNDVLVYSMTASANRIVGSDDKVGGCWCLPWLSCYNPVGDYGLSAIYVGYNNNAPAYGPVSVTHDVRGFEPISKAKAEAFWMNEEYET